MFLFSISLHLIHSLFPFYCIYFDLLHFYVILVVPLLYYFIPIRTVTHTSYFSSRIRFSESSILISDRGCIPLSKFLKCHRFCFRWIWQVLFSLPIRLTSRNTILCTSNVDLIIAYTRFPPSSVSKSWCVLYMIVHYTRCLNCLEWSQKLVLVSLTHKH